MTVSSEEARRGLLCALGCYALWGLFPIYWYPLNHAPIAADRILAHRIVWSAVFSAVALLLGRQVGPFLAVWRNKKTLGMLVLSAFCISMNWLVYLWALTNKHVLDAGLGYFISPLFSILLGRIVFKEPLNLLQKAALPAAAAGILWLAVPAGQIPWVSVLLTLTFGFYGLIRKIAPVAALPGMAWETLMMLPFAAFWLWHGTAPDASLFEGLSALQTAVLLGSGAATTIPLIMFAFGAQRIPLSTLGIIQYFSPTLQILSGLLLFGETLDSGRLVGYLLVWTGVALFLAGIVKQRKSRST